MIDGPFSLKGSVGACDVNVRLHPDDADADVRARRTADGALVLVGRIPVPSHATQVELENTLVAGWIIPNAA